MPAHETRRLVPAMPSPVMAVVHAAAGTTIGGRAVPSFLEWKTLKPDTGVWYTVLSLESHAIEPQLEPVGPLRKNVALPSAMVLKGLKSMDQRTVLVPLVPHARRSPLSARSTSACQPAVGIEAAVAVDGKLVTRVLTCNAL